MDGKQLDTYIRHLFNLEDGDKITPKQLDYALTMIDPVRYALSYHKIKGRPLTFDIPNFDTSKAVAHRPWQKEILRSSASEERDVCVIKSRQLGLSELSVLSLIYWLDTHSAQGVKALYAFPTNKQMQDFYKTRIQTLFGSGYYSTLVDPREMSMQLMHIRDTSLFMRSHNKPATMEGIDVDAVFLDEYDRASKMAEDSAEQSMASSPYKCLRRWSTPTAEGMGVEKLYRESDQRKWFIKCSHCGYEQVLDFEKNIKLINKDGIDTISKVVLPGTYQYVCQKCGKSLESDRWYGGHWETTSPGSGKRVGYSISQMSAVWITPDMLKQQELRAGSKQTFYNYNLGLPYTDDSNRFLPEDVTSHLGDFSLQRTRGDYSKIVVGIDWGEHYHHVVILGVNGNNIDVVRLFRVAKSETVGTLEEDINTIIKELEPYQPDLILPDIGYSGNYVQKLQSHFGLRRVYGVRVRSAKSNQDFNAHFSPGDNTVKIDKLSQNLLLMSNLRRGDIRFYKNMDTMERLFIEHGSNVVIRTEDKTDPRTGEVQNELTISRRGDDHFFQAMVYANVALKEVVNGNYGNISVTELSSFMPERTDLQQELDVESSVVLDF